MIRGQGFDAPKLEAGLYLAATPIGNLGDVTLRVLEAMAGADLIACEDTRVTSKLVRHFAIQTKLVPYHEHNANEAGPRLLADVRSGKSVVLVSDAGTPIVSDPGSRLVLAAREADINVIPLPGASAPLAALVASGLPSESWTFCGFLPTKQGARIAALESRAHSSDTLIFFESPNRLTKTLADMISVFGAERRASVGRELTKMHEEVTTTSLAELATYYGDRTVKGEIVLLVAPSADEQAMDAETLLEELLATLPVSKAAAEAATLTGQPKRDLYQLALLLKERHRE
ncbi:MAG: 16S rRNA (cytidine(1402)-2'-O)-methyltransferase [Pseudomonadota bacterium]